MSEGKRVVRQYPVEFKVDAVKLLEEQGYTVSEAANRLGIPQANLTRKQYREGQLQPGHKAGTTDRRGGRAAALAERGEAA